MRMWMTAVLTLALAMGAWAGAEDAKRVGDAYPLGTCPVSGAKLGSMGDPVIKVIDGREVRFCCGGCPGKFDAAAAGKTDAAIVEQQKANYPTDKCVNSDEPLGDKPTEFVIGNRLVRTCCGDCAKAVKADPAKALAKLDAAVKAKQGPEYKGELCPVSGEKLGSMGDPAEIVLGGRLVKLCCGGCKKGAEKDVAATLAKLDAK